MNEQRYLPDSDRVGVLTSTVLLAFALTHLIQAPEFNLEIQLPGFFLLIPLNLSTAMSVLTAGLTATGMDWLLRSHPSLKGPSHLSMVAPPHTDHLCDRCAAFHPAAGAAWWVGFAVTGTFLFFVFVAEYIVVDPGAPYYAISMAGLTAISYTLFFILAVALRYSSARLYHSHPGFIPRCAPCQPAYSALAFERPLGICLVSWALRLFVFKLHRACTIGPFRQSSLG